MDARDLSAFPEGRFGFVMFSFNGIDAVGREDRAKVLAEVHRVLRPGGLFLMSAHNRNGPGCGEAPRWLPPLTRNPIRYAARVLRHWAHLPGALRNHRRLSALNQSDGDWATMNCAAHDFSVVVVYASMSAQLRQFEAAGFVPERVFDSSRGLEVDPASRLADVWWFHYVVRKPAGAPHPHG